MKCAKVTIEGQTREQFEMVAVEIAEGLADTAIEQLLDYPFACEAVRAALGKLAWNSCCLVFEDRVVDADGNEVANSKRASRSQIDLTPEMVMDLLDGLTSSERNAVLSFWLMTHAHRLCDASAGYKQIVAKMVHVITGNEGSQMAIENLREVYPHPEHVPSLAAWRRALDRGVDKLMETGNGASFLRDLGLPRRR